MYLNGMGLRGIERVAEIHHTTILCWIREAGHEVSNTSKSKEIPEITDLDKLQIFVGSKRNKVGIWTTVNHWRAGILAWAVGDRSAETLRNCICYID